MLDVIIDIPFALPTIVAGLVLLSLYGPTEPDRRARRQHPRAPCSSRSLFVTLPFVVRTVQPVLEELEPDVEEAAASLGASRFTTFRRIILPTLVAGDRRGRGAVVRPRRSASTARWCCSSGNLPAATEVASVRMLTLHRERQHRLGRRGRDDHARGRAVRDRRARHRAEAGVAPWLAPPCVRQPRRKWALRVLVIGYVFFLVAWPASLVVRQTFARRPAAASPDALSATPTSCTRSSSPPQVAVSVGAHQPGLRRRHVAAAGALRVPRQAGCCPR